MATRQTMQLGNRKSAITTVLLRWYRKTARDFPWRRTHNPYRILISEIMLQQTQAGRVEEKYPQFLKRFPNFLSLARASKSSVIRAWRGMGYNNRAVRLQQLAQVVVREHKGRLPRTVEELDSLPGIGKYTSHAIACFAFGQQVPAVDTNVRRVLERIFPEKGKNADIWVLASAALPRGRAYDWNQALFDFGARICRARDPKCTACPINKLCPSAFKVRPNRTRMAKREPGREGIPNRVYRGRIVEVLRNLNGSRSISISQIGPRIKSNYGKRDLRWLRLLLQRLAKDNVVALNHSKSAVFVRLAK